MNKLSRLVSGLWNRSPRENLARLRGAPPQPPAGPPTWCLSTGRVGTQTVAALAGLAPGIDAVHEPAPHLFGLSKQAYVSAVETRPADDPLRAALRAGVEACRSQEQLAGKRYLETSPQGTFVAPLLLELFPESRFIHIVRDPVEVIRSGMRRGWYDGHAYDAWRIVPRPRPTLDKAWDLMTVFEKNTWNWTATNRWILEFVETLPEDRWCRLTSDQLFADDPEAISTLFDFLEVPTPSPSARRSVLGQVLNAQRTGDFPQADDWAEGQLAAVELMAGPLWQQLRLPPDRSAADIGHDSDA